jgi:biopolymer transport protein ExbD
MRFRKRIDSDGLDINLIPLIDVLLVVLIFLAATTTFTRQRAIAVVLPQASAEAVTNPATIELAVSQEGRYAVGDTLVDTSVPAGLVEALRQSAAGQVDPVVVIYADAMSPHQFVIAAMQAARDAGIARVQFATQAGTN